MAECLVNFIITIFYRNLYLTQSVDPDQMPQKDAAKCGVQSGYALFANYPFGGLWTKMG